MVSRKQMVLVVGCDRSGTHWITRILIRKFGFHATMEVSPLYNMTKLVANDFSKWDGLKDQIWEEYEKHLERAGERSYADKSHPIFWHAEKVAARFPKAKFIVVHRSVYPSISSMITHGGVPTAVKEWKKYPFPILRFGFVPGIREEYEALTIEQKLTLYWQAHKYRVEQVVERLSDRAYLLNYENLITDTTVELDKISDFLSMPKVRYSSRPRRECLSKWEDKLTVGQKRRIGIILRDKKYRESIRRAICELS